MLSIPFVVVCLTLAIRQLGERGQRRSEPGRELGSTSGAAHTARAGWPTAACADGPAKEIGPGHCARPWRR
ncbi:hypothetical protein HBB16_10805 [Pseudonocardia sp. MCCB 268]|nr:hypothetical protein [Pseudonocardia cytotoxica]